MRSTPTPAAPVNKMKGMPHRKNGKICHSLSRHPRAFGQQGFSQPADEQRALVAGHVDGNDRHRVARLRDDPLGV